MGCIYTGIKTRRSVNGFFKVGMTEKNKPTSRLSAYDLTPVCWLSVPKATKAELMLMESAARVAVERTGLAKLHGNDCFAYNARKDKWAIALGLGEEAMSAAIKICYDLGLEWELKKSKKFQERA